MSYTRFVKVALLYILLLLLSYSYAKCDTIFLKNGQRFHGKIIEEHESSVVVKVEGGTVTFYSNEIVSIEKSKVKEVEYEEPKPVEEESAEVKEEPILPLRKKSIEEAPPQGLVEEEPAQIKEEPRQIPEKVRQIQEKINRAFFKGGAGRKEKIDELGVSLEKAFMEAVNKGSDPKELYAFILQSFGRIALIMLVVSLPIYLFYAFCLFRIAKKLAVRGAWRAWLPIFNVFLIVNLAYVSGWWIWAFFGASIVAGLSPVPAANLILPIAAFIFTIYIYCRMAALRGKPAWLGLLIFVPVVNLFFLPYLAFSK